MTSVFPTVAPGEPILYEARQYKNELVARLARFPAVSAAVPGASFAAAAAHLPANILGVGYGAKETDGVSIETDLAVRVYVRAKLPRQELGQRDLIPAEVNGRPTDVVAIGDIVAAQRPVRCGVSVGHFRVGSGTLGCLVRLHGAEERSFILSNNHVLANVNDAAEGDPVLEPGRDDGGSLDDPIATLTDFEPLRFDAPNYYDAAIAELLDRASVLPEIGVIGPVKGPCAVPAVHQPVRKHGRTTLHTVGVIRGIAEDIPVRYANGRTAMFEDQLAIAGVGGDFGRSGDSGSLVVDATTHTPVALLFAVGWGTTFANRIAPVLERFGAAIV
jgi:hypothetical protein